MKRSINIMIIILILMTITVACTNQNSVKPASTVDGMELLKKSSEYYKSLDNYQIKQEMNMSIGYVNPINMKYELINAVMKLDTTVFQKPSFKFKNVCEIYYKNKDDEEAEKDIPFSTTEMYGISENESMIVYQTISEQWYKTKLSKADFVLLDTQGINYITDYEAFIISAKSVVEEMLDDKPAYKVSYDIKPEYMVELFEQYGYMDLVQHLSQEERIKQIIEIMGDASFEVWFSKTDDLVLKNYINLTPILNRISDMYMTKDFGNISEEDKEFMANTFVELKNSEMNNTLEYININNCNDFEVPEEALGAPGL